MDLFRRKQKYIYWIVAIIIIPSFVLVWGVDGLSNTAQQTQADFVVGSVNGRDIGYPEFEAFQKRINAALGGLPLAVQGQPDAGTQTAELSKYLFIHSLLEDAKAAGLTASDLQIGTYIDNSHPVITAAINKADPASRAKAIDDFCRSMNITQAQLLQGIREWQTVGNYIDADSRLAAVNDESVYAFYSLNAAEIVTKNVRIVENEALRDLAKAEIMEKPEAELQLEARNYAAAKANDPRYRTSAKWRFSWVLVPFVPETSVPQPTEEEIAATYAEGNATNHYPGQTLEQARDHIIQDHFIRPEVDRQTMRNFSVDVDPQLRSQADLPLEELVKLTQLAKYGVTAAETGAEALPSREVVQHFPEGIEGDFAAILEAVDTSPAEARDSMIAELKGSFNLAARPYRSEKGLFRIRLLDYQPSVPAPLDGEDGAMAPELYEIALADMVGERAAAMAREQADATETHIRELMLAREAGEPAPDAEFAAEFDAMPETTVKYLENTTNYALGTLPIGDILGPNPYVAPDGERGQELIVAVDRHVPNRERFAAEPEDVKNTFRSYALYNYRGGYGMTYTELGPTAVLNPGPSLWGGLMDKFMKGGIRVNPELAQQPNEG